MPDRTEARTHPGRSIDEGADQQATQSTFGRSLRKAIQNYPKDIKVAIAGTEIVMWMMMRGALSKEVNLLHKSYFLPSMTAIATLVFEDAFIR